MKIMNFSQELVSLTTPMHLEDSDIIIFCPNADVNVRTDITSNKNIYIVCKGFNIEDGSIEAAGNIVLITQAGVQQGVGGRLITPNTLQIISTGKIVIKPDISGRLLAGALIVACSDEMDIDEISFKKINIVPTIFTKMEKEAENSIKERNGSVSDNNVDYGNVAKVYDELDVYVLDVIVSYFLVKLFKENETFFNDLVQKFPDEIKRYLDNLFVFDDVIIPKNFRHKKHSHLPGFDFVEIINDLGIRSIEDLKAIEGNIMEFYQIINNRLEVIRLSSKQNLEAAIVKTTSAGCAAVGSAGVTSANATNAGTLVNYAVGVIPKPTVVEYSPAETAASDNLMKLLGNPNSAISLNNAAKDDFEKRLKEKAAEKVSETNNRSAIANNNAAKNADEQKKSKENHEKAKEVSVTREESIGKLLQAIEDGETDEISLQIILLGGVEVAIDLGIYEQAESLGNEKSINFLKELGITCSSGAATKPTATKSKTSENAKQSKSNMLPDEKSNHEGGGSAIRRQTTSKEMSSSKPGTQANSTGGSEKNFGSGGGPALNPHKENARNQPKKAGASAAIEVGRTEADQFDNYLKNRTKAFHYLAEPYLNDEDVNLSPKMAFTVLEMLALESGDIRFKYALAMMYRMGLGVKRDFQYYKKLLRENYAQSEKKPANPEFVAEQYFELAAFHYSIYEACGNDNERLLFIKYVKKASEFSVVVEAFKELDFFSVSFLNDLLKKLKKIIKEGMAVYSQCKVKDENLIRKISQAHHFLGLIGEASSASDNRTFVNQHFEAAVKLKYKPTIVRQKIIKAKMEETENAIEKDADQFVSRVVQGLYPDLIERYERERQIREDRPKGLDEVSMAVWPAAHAMRSNNYSEFEKEIISLKQDGYFQTHYAYLKLGLLICQHKKYDMLRCLELLAPLDMMTRKPNPYIKSIAEKLKHDGSESAYATIKLSFRPSATLSKAISLNSIKAVPISEGGKISGAITESVTIAECNAIVANITSNKELEFEKNITKFQAWGDFSHPIFLVTLALIAYHVKNYKALVCLELFDARIMQLTLPKHEAIVDSFANGDVYEYEKYETLKEQFTPSNNLAIAIKAHHERMISDKSLDKKTDESNFNWFQIQFYVRETDVLLSQKLKDNKKIDEAKKVYVAYHLESQAKEKKLNIVFPPELKMVVNSIESKNNDEFERHIISCNKLGHLKKLDALANLALKAYSVKNYMALAFLEYFEPELMDYRFRNYESINRFFSVFDSSEREAYEIAKCKFITNTSSVLHALIPLDLAKKPVAANGSNTKETHSKLETQSNSTKVSEKNFGSGGGPALNTSGSTGGSAGQKEPKNSKKVRKQFATVFAPFDSARTFSEQRNILLEMAYNIKVLGKAEMEAKMLLLPEILAIIVENILHERYVEFEENMIRCQTAGYLEEPTTLENLAYVAYFAGNYMALACLELFDKKIMKYKFSNNQTIDAFFAADGKTERETYEAVKKSFVPSKNLMAAIDAHSSHELIRFFQNVNRKTIHEPKNFETDLIQALELWKKPEKELARKEVVQLVGTRARVTVPVSKNANITPNSVVLRAIQPATLDAENCELSILPMIVDKIKTSNHLSFELNLLMINLNQLAVIPILAHIAYYHRNYKALACLELYDSTALYCSLPEHEAVITLFAKDGLKEYKRYMTEKLNFSNSYEDLYAVINRRDQENLKKLKMLKSMCDIADDTASSELELTINFLRQQMGILPCKEVFRIPKDYYTNDIAALLKEYAKEFSKRSNDHLAAKQMSNGEHARQNRPTPAETLKPYQKEGGSAGNSAVRAAPTAVDRINPKETENVMKIESPINSGSHIGAPVVLSKAKNEQNGKEKETIAKLDAVCQYITRKEYAAFQSKINDLKEDKVLLSYSSKGLTLAQHACLENDWNALRILEEAEPEIMKKASKDNSKLSPNDYLEANSRFKAEYQKIKDKVQGSRTKTEQSAKAGLKTGPA